MQGHSTRTSGFLSPDQWVGDVPIMTLEFSNQVGEKLEILEQIEMQP